MSFLKSGPLDNLHLQISLRMKVKFISAATILPLFSLAHPGHGETDGFSIIHYFSEPMHAIVTVGAIVVMFAGYRYFRRKSQKSK
jgi:hypothetical protein